jgi:hypothetical protein
MSINLLRNSKVFFTTHVSTDAATRGEILLSGFNSSNTFEIQVLDDLSFSQTTAVETIGINETGDAPKRGQRSFNTALNPVDFNFTTYMRPYQGSALSGTITAITATYNSPGASAGNYSAGAAFPPHNSTQDQFNASTTFTNVFGPNTVITVEAPAGGTAAVIAPVFGTNSTLGTSGKLVGFRIVSGGTGYPTGTGSALTVNVYDPDSDSESGHSITFTYTATNTATGLIECEERHLWNAMFSNEPISTTNAGNAAWKYQSGSQPSYVTLKNSGSHQLQRFGLIVIFDKNCFLLDDCSLNQAVIDFGIDAIASIQWSGQARKIRRIAAPGGTTEWAGSLTGSAPSYTPKVTSAPFLANKLSTVKLIRGIGQHDDTNSAQTGAWVTGGTADTNYIMPLTGGSITLTNNITYLTPAYMGSINQPVTYFTGSRSITGSLTAYLRTGGWDGSTGDKYSANLFSDLVNAITTDSDPEFKLQISIGGTLNLGVPHVELEMPGVVLTIPTVNAEQVITTTVNFTAQGTEDSPNTAGFNILNDNEIKIKYYA